MVVNVGRELRALATTGALDFPPLGGGATPDRWRALAGLARRDVSLGRLAEAHVDAQQILAEAGRTADPRRLLGVWASEHPTRTVRARRSSRGFELTGSKGFCTGAGIVDAALVTAATDDGPQLLLVDLAAVGPERIDLRGWHTPALADTCTATVDLEGIEVPLDAAVAGPGWYLDRPGFWLGAVGPAACWAGAAQGLVDHAAEHVGDGPHARAHLGALLARSWALDAVLAGAGRAADDPAIDADGAHRLALTVRHLVDDGCEDVQRRFERALGPRALAGDAAVAERNAALTLYRRQCHAEADLEALGRDGAPPPLDA